MTKIPGLSEMEHLPLNTILSRHERAQERRRKFWVALAAVVFVSLAVALVI